jgi:iron complex outermembrane receptor protein
MRTRWATALLLATCSSTLPAAAAAADQNEESAPDDVDALSRLSIEELAQLPVRSASKREEPLAAAPTALYAITGEEIEASAATSLPEALRLAPNLGVQQVNGFEYAITARGFNSIETSNKLLVLIDGRSVYTPLHSGVFWQLHSPLLEDIGQIEVISGPGGTLYGPNAVNGVINVTTRDARDTLGGMVRGTAGPDERTAAARYGFALGEHGALRVYGNWFERENLPDGPGPDVDDGFHGWQAGFRADFEDGADHFTLQGDLFDNAVDVFAGDGNDGHNLLARWARALSPASSVQVQAYYDDFERRSILTTDRLETFDVETQYSGSIGAHDLVVGAGIRTTRDQFINDLNPFRLDPESRRLWVYNIFAQDRFRLSPELSLIAGLKVEDSTFAGSQFLPNLRLAWQPDETTLIWAAASRAVRTPSRIDRQLQFLPILAPAADFRSEKLTAFEAGFRGQPFAGTSLSVSVFLNLYDDIRTTELSPGGVLPIRLSNGLQGRTYGIEAWSRTQVTPWWRLDLGASAMGKEFRVAPGRVDIANRDSLGHDPDFQLLARSQFDLGRFHANAGLRFIGEIDTDTRLGSYVEADARLGYRIAEGIELFVAGSNLLRRSHVESNDAQRAQRAERSLYAGTRLRF